MKLKAVGRISMGDLGLEIGRQVDNIDGAERTFFGTDAASDTKAFGYESNFRLRCDLDAEPAGSDDGTRLFAFLATFLGALSVLPLTIQCGIVVIPSACTVKV